MVVALVVVVAGSFAVSASSTLHLGGANGMHGLPQLALVLVLEVAAITGTAIYVATKVKRVRIKAAVVVVGATAVALVGGVSTYSLLGLVAPLLMVVVVELIADFWHVVTDQRANQDDHLRAIVAEPVVDQAWSGPDTVELPRQPDTVPVEVVPQLEAVSWSVDQIVADLHEQEVTDPSGQYIRKTYSVGKAKADRVLAALRPNEVAS